MFVPQPLHPGYHMSQMQEQSTEKGSMKEMGDPGGGRRAGVDEWVVVSYFFKTSSAPTQRNTCFEWGKF